LVSLITRLRRFIDITRVGDAQRVKLALQDTELLTQITNLALQLLHLIAMPGTALLRFTGRRVQFLLQAGGRLPLALDFQQRPGFGGSQPFLRQRAVGTQLVQLRGEIPPGSLGLSYFPCKIWRFDPENPIDQELTQSLIARKLPNGRALLQAALRAATARFCTESTTTPDYTPGQRAQHIEYPWGQSSANLSYSRPLIARLKSHPSVS